MGGVSVIALARACYISVRSVRLLLRGTATGCTGEKMFLLLCTSIRSKKKKAPRVRMYQVLYGARYQVRTFEYCCSYSDWSSKKKKKIRLNRVGV